MEDWIKTALEQIRTKMDRVSDKTQDKIPYTTDKNGNYNDLSEFDNNGGGLDWWTNGFWGGTLWKMYEQTGDKKYSDYAIKSEKKLQKCLEHFTGLNHDVGFMFMPTSGADYRLTGSEESLITTLHAANLLAGRFNPAGNFIRAWNGMWGNNTGWAIIDSMMNLSLLYFASKHTGDPRFKNIAMRHADTLIDAFVRADGSCCHIVEFDPETGKRIKSYAGQGYAHGSSWTRGQAWGIYGFTISYIHTKEERYLSTAIRISDYCISKIPADYIIPIDFCAPAELHLEDGCGAAIMASGLIELSKYVNPEKSKIYLETGKNILKAIHESRCDYSSNCDAFVQNCSASYNAKEHHITMNYADYFYIEALQKLAGIGTFMW